MLIVWCQNREIILDFSEVAFCHHKGLEEERGASKEIQCEKDLANMVESKGEDQGQKTWRVSGKP